MIVYYSDITFQCFTANSKNYGHNKGVPGGDIVLSNTEGMVISITGLRDGMPFKAS